MNILKKLLSIFKYKVDTRIRDNHEKQISKENLKKHIESTVEEYNLIQRKQSNLPRTKRDNVIAYMKKLEELGYVNINRNE